MASKSNRFNESEMALFYECMLKCARKLLDAADIVREAMLRKPTLCPKTVISYGHVITVEA